MDRLSALFINHQDPDVGSSASIISARYAPKAGILCSEDTWRLIVHLNLPRNRFIATEKFAQGLSVPTGHKLLPVPSPFCHFRGAVMLYDPETRVLFTGDLFGGLTDAKRAGPVGRRVRLGGHPRLPPNLHAGERGAGARGGGHPQAGRPRWR